MATRSSAASASATSVSRPTPPTTSSRPVATSSRSPGIACPASSIASRSTIQRCRGLRADAALDLLSIAPHALVERLDEELGRLASGGRTLVAFDADGTLWSGDVGIDIFEALMRVDGVREAARAALEAEARAHGLPATGT